MRERGIIFSAESVRAILASRKTQTRRVVNFHRPITGLATVAEWVAPTENRGALGGAPSGYALLKYRRADGSEGMVGLSCPYGAPGDRLWVRETFRAAGAFAQYGTGRVWYRADGVDSQVGPWRSPIHMPRWASRLTLVVEAVRVERLHAITEEDARAEGAEPRNAGQDEHGPVKTHRTGFVYGWERINGKRAPWSSNPWVWVVTFRRVG